VLVGASWSPFSSNLGNTGTFFGLAVHDDGSGEALYACGSFSLAPLQLTRVVRWDGASWSPVGRWDSLAGMTGVLDLEVLDDGSGPVLFAGGSGAGGVARWDGASRSTPGGGVDGTVLAMAVFDDGGGPALYVAGDFHSAGGVPAAGIARWDGSCWTALDSGLTGSVKDLVSFRDPHGPALFVAGEELMARPERRSSPARPRTPRATWPSASSP
jgi:hypothetical protein